MPSNSEDDQNSKLDSNPSSIDQSLDAIENQLASISIIQSEPEPEPVPQLLSEFDHDPKLTNGSLSDNLAGTEELTHNNSVMEEPGSPSSSGYAGERGSSNSSTSSFRNGEIDGEVRVVSDNADGVLDSNVQWLPGKRHGNEIWR